MMTLRSSKTLSTRFQNRLLNFFLFIVLLFALNFFLVSLLSCQSSDHLPVPGEETLVRQKIASEYMALGDSYNELEKFDKAIEYYQKALKDKTLYWTVYYKLARCYAMNKNYPQAKKMYFTLHKRDRNNLNINLSLAYLYAMDGDLDRAEVIYAYIWKENPNSSDALTNYIDVLIAQKKYAQAQSFLGFLKERFSDNTNIALFESKLNEFLPKKEIPLDEEEKENVLPDDKSK